MGILVRKTALQDILYLRELFLQENNFQIRYDSCHTRGWSDSYLVEYNGVRIGYGAIKGNEKIEDRDTIFEYYLIPPFRSLSGVAFEALANAANVSFIECQSNDTFLTSFAQKYGRKLSSNTILFSDNALTNLLPDEGVFRLRTPDDKIFEHYAEPPGNFVIAWKGEVIATGGYFLHYNMPFADIYMEVREDCRRMGFGSFLVQEIKLQCYLSGRIPAARTGSNNIASKATLLKAGFGIVGHMLLANLR